MINLSEKIGLILDKIDFGSTPNSETFDELKIIKTINSNNSKKTEFYLDEMKKNASRIKEEDLAELKSFKAPPSRVQTIAEAICYLFAKQATYQNFVKLLSKDSFLKKLKNFDYNSINDYKLIQLEKYITSPDFESSTVAIVSHSASIFCDWIHSVYNYGQAVLIFYLKNLNR